MFHNFLGLGCNNRILILHDNFDPNGFAAAIMDQLMLGLILCIFPWVKLWS